MLAQEEARLLQHNFIGTEHLLLGLILERDGVAAQTLAELDLSLADVRTKVEEVVGRSGLEDGGSPPFTPRAKKVLELALREALQLGHTYIGTEHILLGILREGGGVASQVLVSLGVEPAQLRQQLMQKLVLGYQEAESGALTASSGGRLVECSFCGRRPPASGRLVSGRGGSAYICEHCLQDLTQSLAEPSDEDRPVIVGPVVITGQLPPDEEAARTDITRAFTSVFVLSQDRRTVPNVEGGERLGSCLKEAQERHAALRRKDHAVSVAAIEFVDERHASVSFTLSLEGVPATMLSGEALAIDGVWTVARSTFCALMDLVGVRCPSEE